MRHLDCTPRFPSGHRPAIGIVGCGAIVRDAHLPAYAKYGVEVRGVVARGHAACAAAREIHPIGRVCRGLDELLDDPLIEVVDIATPPEVRPDLIRQALEAGRHVLAQKPLALDLETARSLVDLADARGVRLAVNQNARWAPAWRVATMLIDEGAIGEPFAVCHLQQEHNGWLTGERFDSVPHFLIVDFTIHFLDVIRCWLDGKQPRSVRAWESRPREQPPGATQPWGMTIAIDYADGSSGLINAVGRAAHEPRFPFWIEGTEGMLSGDLLADSVAVTRGGTTTHVTGSGEWFPDGFGATLGELLCSIEEDREPFNSARHNLESLALTFAACESADHDGAPVGVPATA